MVIDYLLWPFSCFIIGGIPSGLIIGRLFGSKDLRKHGSHNIGATNAYRILGVAPGLLTLLSDILKGLIPLIILKNIFTNRYILVFCGMAAILGHDYSPYLKFKGGKGVATSLGVFLILSPKAIIPTVFIWVLILITGKVVSLASIGAGVFLPFFVFYFNYPKPILVTAVFGGILLIYRHKENIRRLLKGEEKRLNKKPCR